MNLLRAVASIALALMAACAGSPAGSPALTETEPFETRVLTPDSLRPIGTRPTLPAGYEAVAFPPQASRGVLGGVAVLPAPGAEPILLALDHKSGDIRRMSDGSSRLVVRFPSESAGLGFQVFAVGDTDRDGADEFIVSRGTSPHTQRHVLDLVSVSSGEILGSAARGALGSQLVRSAAMLETGGCATQIAFSTIPTDEFEAQGSMARLEVLRLPGLESIFVLTEPHRHSWWGWAVRWVDDLDQDGSSDLLVSAPRFRNRSGSVGRLYMYSGRDGHELASCAPEDFGIPLEHKLQFGTALTVLDDFDGDGAREIVVVADLDRRSSGDADDVARIMLVNLHARSLVRDLAFMPGDYASFLTPDVVAIEDCDADGHPDILVTCPEYVEESRDRLSMCGACSFTSSGTGSVLAAFAGNSDRDDGEAVYGALDASTRTGGRTVVVQLGDNAIWIRPRGKMNR